MSKKIAAVVAASGTQGFSIVKALVENGYHVRALTRSPDSDKTRSLFGPLGVNVEPFAFDLNKPKSIREAFKGASLVFAVTIPEDDKLEAPPGTPESEYEGHNETEQGLALAEAAAAAGVEYYIYSTLDDAAKPYADKYGDILSYSQKAATNQRVIDLGLPGFFIHQGFFSDNLNKSDWARVKDDGSISLVVPHLKASSDGIPLVSVAHDTGRAVMLLLKNYASLGLKNKAFNLTSGIVSAQYMADTIAKVSGRKVVFEPPSTMGAVNSDYDRLMKFMFDPETNYFPNGEVPDGTLKSLGFEFQSFEDYVRETLLPYLGISGA